MKRGFTIGLAVFAVTGAFALDARPSAAETSREIYAVDEDALRKDFPRPRDNPALEKWRDGRDWRYGSGYLFGVTRGLKDQDIPPWCERAAWIITVPFDIANLPFTALAGLFGD